MQYDADPTVPLPDCIANLQPADVLVAGKSSSSSSSRSSSTAKEHMARVIAGLLYVACGGLDAAHNLVTPLCWGSWTPYAGKQQCCARTCAKYDAGIGVSFCFPARALLLYVACGGSNAEHNLVTPLCWGSWTPYASEIPIPPGLLLYVNNSDKVVLFRELMGLHAAHNLVDRCAGYHMQVSSCEACESFHVCSNGCVLASRCQAAHALLKPLCWGSWKLYAGKQQCCTCTCARFDAGSGASFCFPARVLLLYVACGGSNAEHNLVTPLCWGSWIIYAGKICITPLMPLRGQCMVSNQGYMHATSSPLSTLSCVLFAAVQVSP
jgi:hypothetical protein